MQSVLRQLKIAMGCIGVMTVLFAPVQVGAQYQNEEIGGEVLIDKKIKSFSDGLVADNFDKGQKVFVEGETIEFIVTVENTSDETFENIKVTDKLPVYLKLIFYPGTYNTDSNIVEWRIDELKTGEIKRFNIRGMINGVPSWYSSTNPRLMENVVYADGDRDTAKYYVMSKTVPTTGDVDMIYKTGILAMTAAAGWSLRKFSRDY